MKTFILTLLLCLFAAGAHAAAADAKPSVAVITEPVQQGSLPKLIEAYGTVEPLPNGVATISLPRSGQVVRLAVNQGQAVRGGDALLDFVSDPAALLAYNQAVTAVAAAKKEQVRTQQLLAQRLATQSQLAQANKALSDAEAALEAEQRQGSGVQFATVTAPFSGTVTTVSIANGDRIQANVPLLQLTHGSGLAVSLGLPLDDCAAIQNGNPVQLRTLDSVQPVSDGTVAFIGNMLDPKTRLVNVLVGLPEANAATLITGEQFRALIETGRVDGVIVPRQAVLKDNNGSYLFQSDGTTAHRVNVRILGESGDKYAVAGTVNDNQAIVTSGNYQLEDGAAVREADAKPSATP